MSDETVREQLSSLMDGELPPDSARFLSKRLGNDADLAATWERWHCARDILRQHAGEQRDPCPEWNVHGPPRVRADRRPRGTRSPATGMIRVEFAGIMLRCSSS